MIKDIKELNFPAYATLETATASIADMGDRTITTQVKIDGNILPDFSYDWEVEFQGERYIHPVRTPQGTKDNSSCCAKIDLTFRHWAIHEMKREMFADMTTIEAGTAIPNKYIADINLNLGNFVTNFNLVLKYYFDGKIVMKLNPEWKYSEEAVYVNLSNAYIWDILQKMHEIYGVRWTLKTNAEGVCEILLGYPANELSHVFEYGFEGGLLSVQRQVQNSEIRNRLLGRGGDKNLPYRYFKDKDPNNPLFEADPDWIPELENITFTELRGKTFRDYVRGWKAKRYGGTLMSEPTEAYLIGYNAEKFDPIEYVEDKESIEKYGVLLGALENNEGIYPSIQGAPGDVDMIVDAEQVTDDDMDAAIEEDSVATNLESGHQTKRNVPAYSATSIDTLTKRYFSVPNGKVGNLDASITVTGKYSNMGNYEETYPILNGFVVTIYNRHTGKKVMSKGTFPVVKIPAGDYYYMISADVESNYDKPTIITLNIESVYLYVSNPEKEEGWKPTFNIWIRNIWDTHPDDGESKENYADRVWRPILGDRLENEAKVVFASGVLSFSSDWEFAIVGYAYDDSKPDSHWRLTLAKSESELKASGKYIPYEGYNAASGDRFFFIGIDMPHQYVLWGEERIDDYKRDRLLDTSEIKPTWVVKTDKVRLNQDRKGEILIKSLSAGSQIRLTSKQFISGAYETLYVQSLTYTWNTDTILYPDVEVVLSDKVAAVKNPVALIQSNVESLQKQVGSLSNIQQIIRYVCDKLYLRKDGIEDLSKSPTRFLGKVSGEKFRQGQVGGRDWGIYRDENGNAIFEADKIVARQGILVSDLVVNEATYVGGLQINSAAAMKVTAVEDSDTGYVCYFDQQQGSVTNKFKVDDVVLCQKFDADDSEVKFYKSRVLAVSDNRVTLSKTEIKGAGIPAIDDEIIHYGNYTDKTRQFVIIRDVIGGGYERMLMGLNSVTSEGIEYYFAGKSADSQARWFVGDAEQYAKYENGQLSIKGNIFVTGSDKTIKEQIADLDFIRETFGEDAKGLILGTAIIVGYNDDEGNFVPMAGLSGVFDKDQENGGPAAWYGGSIDNAKSMIFMDGTGYFADGLFKWDRNTGINLGNDAIKINYDGSVGFGDQIRIGASGEETLGSLMTIVTEMSKMFYWHDSNTIRTRYNLIIEGDTATGEGGQNTPSSGLNESQLQAYLDRYKYTTEGRVQEMISQASFGGFDPDLYYTKDQVNELIDQITAGEINLANYYTKPEINVMFDNLAQYYLTRGEADLTYIKKGEITALENKVTDLESTLYDNQAGKINTWDEVLAFLNGYDGSKSLSAIESELVDSIEDKLPVSEFDTYKAGIALDISNLQSVIAEESGRIDSNEGDIRVLKSYFTNGVANRAYEDADGNTIGTYYTPKATFDEFVTETEEAISNLPDYGEEIASLQELTASQGTQIASNKTFIEGFGRRIDAIEPVVSSSAASIATLTGRINGIDSSILALQGQTSGILDDVSALEQTVGTFSTSIEELLSWKSNVNAWLKYFSYDSANGAVKISAHLIVTGDIASGEEGSITPSEGTVTGIYIDGRTYSPNALGVVDISKAFEGLDVDVSWSEIVGRPTDLSEFTNNAGYATQNWVLNKVYAQESWVESNFLAKAGGTITGSLTINSNLNVGNNIVGKTVYVDNSADVGIYFASGSSYAGIYTHSKQSWQSTAAMIYSDGSSEWKHDMSILGGLSVTGGVTVNSITIGGVSISKYSNGVLLIDGSVIITGDTASGEEGSTNTSTGGISAIKVGSVTYGEVDITGSVLNLTSLFNGYATTGELSSLESRVYALETTSGGGISSLETLTFSAGTFSAGSYDGTSAKTINIPTNYTHLGMGSGSISLNGSSSTFATVSGNASAKSFYAPTTAGTKGYILQSNGSGAPQWVAPSSSGGGITESDVYSIIDGYNFIDQSTALNYLSYYLPLEGGVMTGNLYFDNGLGVRGLSSGGADLSLMEFNTSNALVIGWDVRANSFNTLLCGNIVRLYSKNGEAMRIDTNGYVGIGTTTPSYKLHVSGSIYATGSVTQSSDMRFKEVLENKTLSIESIAEAPLFLFRWNDFRDYDIHLGTSAQYWKVHASWLTQDRGNLSLEYATLGVAMGISIAREVVSHEERIKILESRVKTLESRE